MGINVSIILLCKERAHIQSDVSCFGIVSAAICEPENKRQYPPVLCTAPIKVSMFPVLFNFVYNSMPSFRFSECIYF